jgi:hypothetical protein
MPGKSQKEGQEAQREVGDRGGTLPRAFSVPWNSQEPLGAPRGPRERHLICLQASFSKRSQGEPGKPMGT